MLNIKVDRIIILIKLNELLFCIYLPKIKVYSCMNFRDSVKRICKQKGLTQKELADKLGITDVSLNQTLRGEYPQLQTLERIAIALEVPIAELFEQLGKDTIICPNCGSRFRLESLSQCYSPPNSGE
jgi:DNA-binding Xre family transcriptional regulator